MKMQSASRSSGQSLFVLHPVFALTGILHAIGGALLPSIAATLHLTDIQSGGLFFSYFAGTSAAALLCIGPLVRLMGAGFVLAAATCFGIAAGPGTLMQPLFFVLGVGVGIPMAAVSMFAGRKFGERSAAPLTFLNFTWSGGALLAPLLAGRVLAHQSYRSAYFYLGMTSMVAALACWILLKDPPPAAKPAESAASRTDLRWVVFFALLAFLEVGIENTTATWLATFTQRSSGAATATAAVVTSLYWVGFLASRGLSALILMRVRPMVVLRTAVAVALVAAVLLVGLTSSPVRNGAMLLLGAALAPIFPLLLAQFFARARNSANSRWVLAICGFGGSVMPWVTGSISSISHSLRWGLATVPASLLLIFMALPLLGARRKSQGVGELAGTNTSQLD